MPTSVRLDPETERELERIARLRELSKSEVIREAIHAYGADAAAAPATTLAESWDDLIGALASGRGDLSTEPRGKIVERIRERHRPKQPSSRRP